MTSLPRAVLALALTSVPIVGDAPRAKADDGYRVVVSPEMPVTSLKRAELARIFLRKQIRVKGGPDLVPIDQSIKSPVRATFTKDILASEGYAHISDVMGYWTQEIYSGRGKPPGIRPDDKEVVKFVATTPGAIGYVSGTADVGGVKVLTVEE